MKVPDAIIKVKDLELVEFLDYVQTILNKGLYEIRVLDAAPSGSANDGELASYIPGEAALLYVHSGGIWYSVGINSLDGGIAVGTGTGATVGTATNQKLAFFGSTPVVQQAALTVNVGTVTFSEPTTPDYAIASLTSVNGFGFSTLDEGHSILKVLANLQTRVNELSTRLTTYGFLSA